MLDTDDPNDVSHPAPTGRLWGRNLVYASLGSLVVGEIAVATAIMLALRHHPGFAIGFGSLPLALALILGWYSTVLAFGPLTITTDSIVFWEGLRRRRVALADIAGVGLMAQVNDSISRQVQGWVLNLWAADGTRHRLEQFFVSRRTVPSQEKPGHCLPRRSLLSLEAWPPMRPGGSTQLPSARRDQADLATRQLQLHQRSGRPMPPSRPGPIGHHRTDRSDWLNDECLISMAAAAICDQFWPT